MKHTTTLIATLLCLSVTGCSSTISDDVAAKYAKQISDGCKHFAAEATQRGYKLIPTYSACIDDALMYLEAKRIAKAKLSGNKFNALDIASYFTKEEAKSRLTKLAKEKWKSL